MAAQESLRQRIRQGIFDMGHVWLNEMKTLVKDEGVVIFFIIVPLLYPLLYSWAYNNEVVREVPVAVIDDSHSSLSREFIRLYDSSPDVKVARYCNNMEEAKTLIGHQEVYGYVYLPSDFSTKVNRMEQSRVVVYTSMSFMLYYKAIYQTAVSVSSSMNADIQVKVSGQMTDRENELLTAPMTYEEVALFNKPGGYGSFIIPGVLVLILQQTLLLGIGMAAGTARETNRERALVPVSTHYHGIFRIVLGKSACYTMVYAVLAAYELLVVPRLFNFIHIGNHLTILAVMVPFILACVFFGMFLSCIVRYRENIILLIVFTSVPFLFLSGVSWPLSGIPSYWQGVSWLIPSTFGIRAFVRINSMGATLKEVQVEYIALWMQVLAYFFLACIVYRGHVSQAQKRHEESQASAEAAS